MYTPGQKIFHTMLERFEARREAEATLIRLTEANLQHLSEEERAKALEAISTLNELNKLKTQ